MLNDLSKALEYMHSKGIAHLDLKLENVLIRLLPAPSAIPAAARVDEESNNPYQHLSLIVHDFDTCANLNNPVKRPFNSGNFDETEMIAKEGTSWVKSPEQCLGNEYKGHGEASPSARAILGLNDQKQKIEALKTFYTRIDCYAFSLLAHIMMSGKMPAYLHKYLSNPALEWWITQLIVDFDDLKNSAPAQELADNFPEAATKRGFDEELIKLVVRGFSTNPAYPVNLLRSGTHCRNDQKIENVIADY